MLTQEVTLINPLGLHARAAAKLVDVTKTLLNRLDGAALPADPRFFESKTLLGSVS